MSTTERIKNKVCLLFLEIKYVLSTLFQSNILKKKFILLLQFMVNFIMKHKHNRQKGKVQASQKNFKENIFHHVMQVDAYTLKKAIQKIQFKRIFVSKNLRSTIRF